ncbi:thioredoxin-disulfide reductase [Tannockella kyphosi]|uniref:thioredoxin-disulfide reductase n=1 Tax=Tannockella kyphosi TaxID=2899121 RepID=UPI002011EDD7|nr:thioredoxin-disulfide reductase [Tannockella kyphosi]
MIDIIIIGAGPAGLSAALYASRAGASVLMLDGAAPGGKLNVSAEIENWPGQKKVAGPDLAYQMFEHGLAFGASYEYGLVEKVEDLGDYKVVVTTDKTYEARMVLVASGTVERKLGLEKEEELTGKGISYCAVCDGPFFKEEEVAVIGGGNSALEEANYLTKFASIVHLIVRRDQFRADKIVQDKIKANDKIKIHFLQKPIEIIEENNKVAGLVLEHSQTSETMNLPVKGIFPYVGLDPITSFVSHLGITNKVGYIEVDKHMETNVKGIFGAGDVIDKVLRQVVTATNDGAIAGQYMSELLQDQSLQK